MNFEQNFSPLDTESSEYQSINIVPLIEPISADPEQEEPKKPLAKIEQPVKIREIKPLPKVTAPKVDIAKVPKVERGPSFTFPAEEVDNLYSSFTNSTNYINDIVSQKLKEFDGGGEETKGAADSVRGYMSLINQANNPNDLAKRTDLVYNMMNEISDIQTNNATRDSFINSQYTPAFYSKSKALADEYNASDLKSVLTPRQYTGLKSLSYGKQGEYKDYLNTITDPKAKEVDKQLAILNLDRIGASIDTNASAKLISDIKSGKADKSNLALGRDLYLQSKYDLLNADEKIREVEFNNPYNLSVTKNIFNRAVERGLLMGESADMLSISSDLSGIDVNRLAEIQRLQQEARGSKAFEEFYNNPSLETFSKNPIGILTELTMESLVALYSHGASRVGAGALQGAAVGTVLPGLGTAAGAGYGVLAGMGLASLNLEMSSAILEGIADAGYDTTSAEDLRKAFQDEKLMSKLKADGYKKGIPIAIFDMLSAGVAGKIITKPAKTVAGKVLAGVAELGAQAGFGMAGEAAGQIVKSGKVYKPVDVLMEGLGELGPGIPEIAFGTITEKAKNNQAQDKRDLAIVVDGLGLQKANDQIDVLIGSGQISQEQGQQLKDETKKAFEQMQKMPSMLSNEARGQIMELVDKRDALMSGSESLDEVFKKQATKEAEAINAQILDIANKDISSQQKQRENAIKESRGTQQEVIPEGGVSQYQGAQAIEAQKTTEADNRNRPLGSEQEKVAFQKAAEPIKVSNVNISQVDDITATMNQMETPSVEFKVDDAVKVGSKADVNNLVARTTNAATPKVVSVSDFLGKPIMVTISDELTTGNVVNPATGNTIAGLMGGIGFNYTEGNTGYAWAYTDEATAQDTLNTAKEIYKRNPEMFPDGIVPVAVVKMGTEAINSNEAVFRVLLDNLNSLPKKNLVNAYKQLRLDISNEVARLEARQKALKAQGKPFSPSERNALNGYKQILSDYLNKNKSIPDVIANISELNINTRPLIMDRITSGEVGLLTDVNRLRADKPVTKALMEGLPKEDIKKIHLGWITEPLRDPSIKNVPARHVIGFVGIDATADSIQKSGHPNYPFALKGMGLGVVEDTVHLASIMPTAYGNAVKKITDAVANNKRITPAESVSRAMPSGLANAIFKGKPIVEQESELSKLIGFLNLSFPSVTFFTDQQSFEDIVASPDVKKYVREGEIIYGLTTDGKIYLNPSIATANTAIHEMGHIWVDYVQNMNPELFNKGISLVEGTDEFEKAKAQLGDNINARKEALAMLIGNRGETITNAAQKSKFKEWLVGLWKFLQEQFPALRSLKPEQIETLTLEQFLGGALQDILSGKPISEKPEEYVNIGAAAQKMSEKPSWFDNTPGAQKIRVTKEFINENPDLVDVIRNFLFTINKNNNAFRGNVNSLRASIDSLINKGTIEIDAKYAKNLLASMYLATPKSKANIAKTISMLKAAERMHSLFDDKINIATKEDVKKSIKESKEYTEDEKNILYGIVDDILPEDLFKFIDDTVKGDSKTKNYYAFASNILKSKDPAAFIHEVGHWGFYNILTPEERVEFFKYAAERFAKADNMMEEEQALGKPFQATRETEGKVTEATYKTNATDNFMEYFAEQFRQYYVENKIDDNKFQTLFKKLSLAVDKILDLFRKAGYNKELVKYFDKIIDARPKKTEQIQETQREGEIVLFEPQLPEIPEGPQGPTPPGEVGPVKEPSGLPKKKEYEWEKFAKEKAKEGEEMIKTSTGRYVAKETMRGQIMDRERTLKEIKKARPSLLSRILSSIKVGMLDNQYNVIKLLESVGRAGELVKAYLLTRNSASTTAMAMAEEAVKNIFGGLSKTKMYTFGDTKISEYVLFNQIIGYQRVISIQRQMDETYKQMVAAYKNALEAKKDSDKSQYIKEYNKHKNRLIENGMLDEGGNYVGETLDTEFALGQVTATQASNLLQEVRNTIGEEEFAKLMTRSEAYSQYFNGMMRSRMEAGLISQDTFNYLSKFFYAPTRYISSVLADPILSMARPTTSYATDRTMKIKNLKGGSERLNASDYEGLLKATIYASEYSIAENRTTNRFYNLVDENKDAFEENGIRLGTRYILIEEPAEVPVADAVDMNVKMIAEGKKPQGQKALPSGQKMLPFRGIEKVNKDLVKFEGATTQQKKTGEETVDAEIVTDEDGNRFYAVQVPLKEGEEYIKTYFNGQRKDIIVPKWFAEAWNNDNIKSSPTVGIIGKLTGANLLRVIATGINPVFGIAQLIPDSISAYASTVGQRKYFPLLIDYPVFFLKTLAASSDIKRKSADYIEANKYGATTNFYNGGSVEFERGLLGKDDKSLEKIIEEWNVPGLKQYILGSKKITETTEQMSKVALYKSIRDGKIAEYKQQFGKEPTGQDLEDIKIESGAVARSTADFHRKGTYGSDLNKIIPYLNAAIQVQRAVLGSAKENKAKTLYYTMEFMAYTGLLLASAIGEFDDDELKEKKRLAYSKWSEFDRANRIPLYFVESEGRFISIKIPDFLVPANLLVSKSIQRGILENKLNYKDTDFAKDMKAIIMSVVEEFPVAQFANLEKVASRNPMYSGISKLFFNRDPYRQEEVVAFEKNTKDYLEGARVGERRAGEVYQKIGKAAISPVLPEGISPKRLEAAANSIPFENNPFSGLIIYGTELATSDKKLFEERYGKGALNQILKSSGISQRYFKEGTKVNQGLIDNSINEIKDRGEFKDILANKIVEKFDSLATTMTKREAFLKIKDDFIKNEYKTLDPEQKKIARTWFDGEFKNLAKRDIQDPMIGQILGMATSDAKLDAINETLQTIKQTDSSKIEFLRTLFQKGLMKSGDMGIRLNQRGMRIKNNGDVNPYFEPQIGYIRDELLRIRDEERAKQ